MAEKKVCVLFAEDDPGDRIPYADFLRAKGFDVTEVCSPDEAKDCLRDSEIPYDIIVLDLVMPEGDPTGGEKVLAFMEENSIVKPVVLATAWGYNGPAKQTMETHPRIVKDIVTKTFLPSELHRRICSVLKHWKDKGRGEPQASSGGSGAS